MHARTHTHRHTHTHTDTHAHTHTHTHTHTHIGFLSFFLILKLFQIVSPTHDVNIYVFLKKSKNSSIILEKFGIKMQQMNSIISDLFSFCMDDLVVE